MAIMVFVIFRTRDMIHGIVSLLTWAVFHGCNGDAVSAREEAADVSTRAFGCDTRLRLYDPSVLYIYPRYAMLDIKNDSWSSVILLIPYHSTVQRGWFCDQRTT